MSLVSPLSALRPGNTVGFLWERGKDSFLEMRCNLWRIRGRGEGGEATVLAGKQEKSKGGWDGQTSLWREHFHKEAGVGGACLVFADFIIVYICTKNKEGVKFPPREKLWGFAVCWRPKCEWFPCLLPKHQAPVWFRRQVISFSIVLNLLLLFIFTKVRVMSSMEQPRLANESWAVKVKLSYECKMEFYIIMHFMNIMMNCDYSPGINTNIYITAPAARLYFLYSSDVKCESWITTVVFFFVSHGFSIIYYNSFRTALKSWVLNVFICSGVPACSLHTIYGKEDKCLKRLNSTATGNWSEIHFYSYIFQPELNLNHNHTGINPE